MAVFKAQAVISAPVEAVAEFHYRPGAMKRLTPPPIVVQLHRAEPLANGSRTDFTLWFGPLPFRWLAVHSRVDRRSGFTDTQQLGPLKRWVHAHHWKATGPTTTLLEDTITYEHYRGLRGLLTRLLFAPPLLAGMFAYRHWVTRRAVKKQPAQTGAGA